MNNFEVCVRAIIFKDDKVLVCQDKKRDYYFFPGGHVEFGEKSEDALIRELKEELNLSIKDMKYIGTSENIYNQDGEKHHEINLVFEIETDNVEDKSKEDHINFFFFDKERFKKEKVLPIALKNVLTKWQKDKNIFWVSKNEIKD